MFETFSQFHFIRPVWFVALIPLALVVVGLILKGTRQNQWTNVIDQHLLKHLLVGQKTIKQSSVSPIFILAMSLLLAVLALAGPTWQKQPLPVFETEISKVIILDLSLSMQSTDIKPNRLTRAKHKIKDILSRTKEGQVALIVYAGDAFVISPLTTDANTILTMVPALSPSLMPVLGSEPQNAFKQANELLVNAGIFSGQIIWITDGIDDEDYTKVADQFSNSRHQISILAIGTADGAPIPLPDGQGFLKNADGSIVLPALNKAPLNQLSAIGSGSIASLTPDDSDIDLLLSSFKDPQEFISSEEDLEMDRWVEFGPWLLFPVILVMAFAFRKGTIVVLFLTLLPATPDSTAAEKVPPAGTTAKTATPDSTLGKRWKSLWQTSDQQAVEAYNNKDHKTAAELFNNKDWKSTALYKSGQYNAASDLLSSTDTAAANYNRGNALAHAGRLEESIAAYEKALEQSPDMEDAEYNKSIVEEMLKQQQEQQKQDQENQQQQDQENQQQDGEQQEGEQDENQQEGEPDENQQEAEDQQQQEQEQQDGEPQQSELEQMSDAEREQVLEQWLRKIKDDPGGLLRRKMYMEYQRRQQQGKRLQKKGEKVW